MGGVIYGGNAFDSRFGCSTLVSVFFVAKRHLLPHMEGADACIPVPKAGWCLLRVNVVAR